MPATGRTRLDVLVTERGLAESRERARALILAGRVEVNGRRADKAGMAVEPDATITVSSPDHPYVGRGGIKLAHAVEAFGLTIAGAVALDVGASTGGFTDVLLRGEARHVVAIDVGHGQMAWRLRQDPRVTVREGVNARHLSADDLPTAWRSFDVVTIDVSFISVRHILPVLPPVLVPGADVVVLVKPQFEARREDVGARGVVRKAEVHERVVAEVSEAASNLGFEVCGMVPSPITGSEGNREFLLHLRWPADRARMTQT
ncbi:MAG: TlyA family RNA methyltransferase [Vicinamibacterales bacterium]